MKILEEIYDRYPTATGAFMIGTMLLSCVWLMICVVWAISTGMVQQNHESYAAWVKLTGNPKSLTFEEFIRLPESAKR